jgi:hypothetical protein
MPNINCDGAEGFWMLIRGSVCSHGAGLNNAVFSQLNGGCGWELLKQETLDQGQLAVHSWQ